MSEHELDSEQDDRPDDGVVGADGDDELVEADGDDGVVNAERCATCGCEIDLSDWHPVATQYTDDGAFRIRTFCSPECRAAWSEE